LPQKPAPKPPEKPAFKPPQRQQEPRRTDFGKRGDIRSVRPVNAPGAPANRGGGQRPARAPEPAQQKIVLPADAQVISIKPPIVVRELAEQLKQKPFKIIADLMEVGVFANVNQAIDEAVAQKFCAKYGYKF